MMSSNGRQKNPKKILLENNMRWNHNKLHPNKIHKFRCRFHEIEVKCIFKASKFESISDHHPITSKEFTENLKIINSVDCKQEELNPFYKDLREIDIKSALLICFHYRIISDENNISKIKSNFW